MDGLENAVVQPGLRVRRMVANDSGQTGSIAYPFDSGP